MSQKYQLSLEQEEVFLLRFADRKGYDEIAAHLNTTKDAIVQRMSLIYKKFNVAGETRGKEVRLRGWLTQMANSTSLPGSSQLALSDQVSTSPLVRLNELRQQLQHGGMDYVTQALTECGELLPEIVRWMAARSQRTELEIAIDVLNQLKLICQFFTDADFTVESEDKFNLTSVESDIEKLVQIREQFAAEIERVKEYRAKASADSFRSYISNLSKTFEEDFSPYLPKQNFWDGQSKLEALLREIFSEYLSSKMSIWKSGFEKGMEASFLELLDDSRVYLSLYEEFRARVVNKLTRIQSGSYREGNIGIDNQLVVWSEYKSKLLNTYQSNLVEAKGSSILSQFDSRKASDVIVSRLLIAASIVVLGPIFGIVAGIAINSWRTGQALKNLKSKLKNVLAQLSEEEAPTIHEAVQNHFNEYKSEFTKLLDEDIQFWRTELEKL